MAALFKDYFNVQKDWGYDIAMAILLLFSKRDDETC